MQGVRKLYTDLAAAAGLALLVCLSFAAPAGAANDAYGHDINGTLPSHIEGEHAMVHYTTRPDHGVSAVTDEIAGHVLAAAERARPAIQQQLGFPPLIPDPDGKTDIYIWEWPINGGDAIAKSDNPDAPRSSGHIKIDSSYLNGIRGSDRYLLETENTVAHELGHLYQFSIAQYQGRSLDMRTVSEGTATYIGGRATGTAGTFYRGPLYGYSLNDPAIAYTTWLFFESLAMDHGTTIIPELFQEIGQGAEPLPALDAVLARRGSSLSAAYATYALRHAAGSWGPTVADVDLLEPPRATKLPRKTPKKPVDLRPADVTVNHLGTGLVRYEPGRAAKSCKSGKLAITVELPPGAATPTLVTRPDASAAPPFATRQFALKGGKAVTKLKWAACKTVGTVVLPNPSTTADGQRFEVTAEFTPPKR